MEKSLDRKLAAIHADPSGSKEFILADAKDADMAFGIGAPGKSPEMHAGEGRLRTLAEYREQIRQIARQGLIDIMLMSASSNQVLTIDEGLFDDSHVTPAARANDASDIFAVRHGRYLGEPARPFRTALLDHIQCGHVDCDPAERARGANLGLYSVTLNNRLSEDLVTLEQYRAFREEAERKGFRHFFEVFDPNNPAGLSADQMPQFINDSIARTLAGVATAGRPIFLKVVYHGPKAMEELVGYDPHLIVGILGGSAGTTYDAFKLIAEAQKVRGPGRLVRPQNQQRRMPIGVRRVSAPDRQRRNLAGGGSAGLSRGAGTPENSAAAIAGRRPAVAVGGDELRRIERERASLAHAQRIRAECAGCRRRARRVRMLGRQARCLRLQRQICRAVRRAELGGRQWPRPARLFAP